MNLQPGDVLCLAEADIGYEVQVVVVTAAPLAATLAPSALSPAAAAASNGAAAAGSLAGSSVEHERAEAAALPPVVAALRVAGTLEDAAASQGLFPPGGAIDGSVPDRARKLMAAGSYEQAHALLLAGAMQQPWAGGEISGGVESLCLSLHACLARLAWLLNP